MRIKNQSYRRYTRRILVVTVVYIGSVGLASYTLPDDANATVGNIVLALVPGIAVVGFIWAMGRLLIELDDEYLRLLEVRKFVVATGITLAIASIWGLLELMITVPKLPVFLIFPIWCLGLIPGQLYNHLTLGEKGPC